MNSGLFWGEDKPVCRPSVSPTIGTFGRFTNLSHVSDFAPCSTSLRFLLLGNIYPPHFLTLASTTLSQLVPLS